jgi:L-alanine-DL-glutamate epimerase-like enolase superfamily enzyme
MTDDMVATPMDAMNVVRLNAADRVKVKVTKHGLDGAQAIVAMLEAAGIVCVLGHVFEMGLAAVAEAQLAACARNLAPPHEIGSLRPMGATADIVADDLRPEPGFMNVPDGPGLGVRIDWAQIDKLRIDRK